MGLKIEIQNFFNDYLPAVESVLCMAGVKERIVLKTIVVHNTHTTDEKEFRIRIISNNKPVVVSPVIMLPLHTLTIEDTFTLEEGDKLAGYCEDANVCTCRVSGVVEAL